MHFLRDNEMQMEEYSNDNVGVCNAPHDVTELVQPTALNDWPALNFKFIDQVRFGIKSNLSFNKVRPSITFRMRLQRQFQTSEKFEKYVSNIKLRVYHRSQKA